MSRRGENIFKRRDGRWEARYIKGHDESGKARYGFCYGRTYTEAKGKMIAMRAQSDLTEARKPSRDERLFSCYCDLWLSQHRSAVKPATYAKYATILERHIKPQLGACRPAAISTEVVERFKTELLTERALSVKTTRDILMVLKMVVAFTKKQLPGAFSELEITYPREQKREMRVLSTEEQARLVSYLTTEMDLCKFGTYLALATGLRIGELCALRWKDISIRNRSITVSAAMQRLKNFDDAVQAKTVIYFGTPKSDLSARTIPLTDQATALCKQFKPDRADAFVLTGTADYMEPRVLQYRFKRYMEDCGLENVHFHTLRHTFATRCVEVGFEIKSLSEVLGHANTSITLNRYVHSSMELKRSNMSKLNAVGL